MMKLMTVVGARPQIIKAAALDRAIRTTFNDQLTEVLVHTGQHYDHGMSEVFFEEMELQQPAYNLNIGSSGHGAQTGAMLQQIERLILKEEPDALLVYGDTNSTLAGALAAVKLHVPLIHVEAGLRSFNKRMPEEVNRITADHASTLLFSPTDAGIGNLQHEGFRPIEQAKDRGRASADNPYVLHCGDLMYDNTLYFKAKAMEKESIFKDHGIEKDNFVLATIHRPQNTDDIQVLMGILNALNRISIEEHTQVVLPLHPRTAAMMATASAAQTKSLHDNPGLKIIPPVGFLEMILLEASSHMVVTDSGGVQKEAFFMERPSIILRNETEWSEIVEHGCGQLSGSDPTRIREAYSHFKSSGPLTCPQLFGNGHAAEFICATILKHLG